MGAGKKQGAPLEQVKGWPMSGKFGGARMRSEREGSQADAFGAAVRGAGTFQRGWSFAEGTGEHNTSPRSSALPLNGGSTPRKLARVVPTELQDEFSKPDLALGTDVDLPPPSGLWFAELRTVVPRPAAKPLAKGPIVVNIQSCFTPREPTTQTSNEADDDKPHWWRRDRAR